MCENWTIWVALAFCSLRAQMQNCHITTNFGAWQVCFVSSLLASPGRFTLAIHLLLIFWTSPILILLNSLNSLIILSSFSSFSTFGTLIILSYLNKLLQGLWGFVKLEERENLKKHFVPKLFYPRFLDPQFFCSNFFDPKFVVKFFLKQSDIGPAASTVNVRLNGIEGWDIDC